MEELNRLTAQPDFWNDGEKAQSIFKEQSTLKSVIDFWEKHRAGLEEARFFLDVARDEKSEEALGEAAAKVAEVAREMAQTELAQLLGGPDDRRNAIVTLHPGAGGTEAQDWAEILLRMYLRWCDRRGYRKEILEYQPGEEAGVKSVTFTVEGDYAYGYMKAEAGIHRLVRISPFDANSRRHTSFASVFVYPEIDDTIKIEINEADLRVDTYRSSGAGGQHVNKTDSAVRLTHLPTGIVVACQNERSQHKNRAMAMKILKSRLYELEIEKQKEKMETYHKTKKDIAWGSQIRSYVLHPYRLVKDHRTNVEVGNADGVLDGDLDQFIQAYLLQTSEPAGS
ncbi:MAG: peptide chain release factor 2 [Deltaproteobacteria bacterium]|nr:peptide chain release factor 2 [Deltaproteobacteria bacterium]MBI2231614.1 peptide chain release factor 2 [Deltaproteobacteria bacterium]MBI3065106.1 peptide chain release factor 2 [Deltaproteobacteria bacterium]